MGQGHWSHSHVWPFWSLEWGEWKCIMCANIYIGIKAWVFQLDPFSFFFFLFFFFFFYLLMLYYLFPYICMGWINQACVIILYFLIFILRNAMLFMKHIYIYIYFLIKSCYVNMIIVGWWRKFFFDTKLPSLFFFCLICSLSSPKILGIGNF